MKKLVIDEKQIRNLKNIQTLNNVVADLGANAPEYIEGGASVKEIRSLIQAALGRIRELENNN